MTKIFLAFASLLAVILAMFIYQKLSVPSVSVNGHSFELLIAKSETDKEIGLSKYNDLDQGKGMIFIFDKPAYYRFWMKSMKFPIDIIFIRDDKISKIVKDAKPPEGTNSLTIYVPNEPINKVLEINAGLSEKYGFKEGQLIKISNLK